MIVKKLLIMMFLGVSARVFSQSSDSVVTLRIPIASYTAMVQNQAMVDAKIHYYPCTGIVWKVGICSALGSPILGAIPAITYSSRIPSDIEIAYPQTELAKNAAYRAEYLQQVQKTKRNKILVGYVAGSCVFVVGIGVLAAIASFSSSQPTNLNLH